MIFYTKQKEEQVTETVRIFDSMTLDVWMRIKTYNSLRGDFLTVFVVDPVNQRESHQEAVEYFDERISDLASYEEASEYWGVIPQDIKTNYDSMNAAVDQYVNYCKEKLPLAMDSALRDSANFADIRKTVVVQSNELYKNIRYSALNTLNAIYENTDRNEIEMESKIRSMMLVFYILSGILIVAIFVTIRVIARSILTPIHDTRTSLELLSKGGLPAIKDYQGKDELSAMLNSLKGFSSHMTNLLSFVSNVAKKNFQEEAKMFDGRGLIAEALINMRDSLEQHDKDEAQRNWIIQGQADLADLVRQQQNLNKFYDQALSYIVKYFAASHGALYIAERKSDQESLALASAYAYARKKFISGSVKPGEGLIGQVYLERQSITLREIPDDYVKITSGLGEALPRCLMVCPLMLNERVYGVLEIASFKIFRKLDEELIQKFAEQFASAIANGQINKNTEDLLRESQLKTETMRVREEEMNNYIDELRSAHNKLETDLNESVQREHHLQSLLHAVNQNIIVVDRGFIIQSVTRYDEYILNKLFLKPVTVGENILLISDSNIKESLQGIFEAALYHGESGEITIDTVKIISRPLHNGQSDIISCMISIVEA